MVSDNRWVATTKGIVVFLLTALLFVFWYDRDRELAESHVTAVRFGLWGWDGRLSDRIMDFVCDPLFFIASAFFAFPNAPPK